MIVDETSFELKKAESKDISVDFFAPEKFAGETYAGRIIVDAGSVRKVISTIIDIKNRQALFDIKLMLKKDAITQDEDAQADIALYNLGTLKPVDVDLFYSIRDFDGNDLAYKEETFAVKEQKLINSILALPNNIEPGNYIFYSKLTYNNQTAVSSSLLTVMPRETKKLEPTIIQKLVKKAPQVSTTAIIILVTLVWSLLLLRMYYIYDKKDRIALFSKEKTMGGQKDDEISKLQRRIEEWKTAGYDTALLELDIKALEDESLGNMMGKLREWKNKGYDTVVLEEEIKSIYSKNDLSQDINRLESKIQRWKKKGYDTSFLEDELKSLKDD